MSPATPSPTPTAAARPSIASRILSITTRYLLPLACSILLILWMFHKINFHSMMAVVRHGVRYDLLILMMCVTTLSHIIRGYRWGIQLGAVGAHCSLMQLSVSIFGTYALNLLFPRAGEVWRCLYISRTKHVRLSTVVGTLVGDRVSDIIVVMILTALAFIVAAPQLHDFVVHYALGRDVIHLVDNPWLWTGIILLILIFYYIAHAFSTCQTIRRIDGSLANLWLGFRSLFTTMPHKWRYLWLTLGIWVCYFLQTYIAFFAFPFTRQLIFSHGTCFGLIPGLVAFVFGSFSMAVPSNGGLGAWNIAVMFALSLFGIDKVQGAAFSMVMWSFESLMLIILGIFTIIYVTSTSSRHNTTPTASPDPSATPSHAPQD